MSLRMSISQWNMDPFILENVEKLYIQCSDPLSPAVVASGSSRLIQDDLITTRLTCILEYYARLVIGRLKLAFVVLRPACIVRHPLSFTRAYQVNWLADPNILTKTRYLPVLRELPDPERIQDLGDRFELLDSHFPIPEAGLAGMMSLIPGYLV